MSSISALTSGSVSASASPRASAARRFGMMSLDLLPLVYSASAIGSIAQNACSNRFARSSPNFSTKASRFPRATGQSVRM